jgi:hypothetical protein
MVARMPLFQAASRLGVVDRGAITGQSASVYSCLDLVECLDCPLGIFPMVIKSHRLFRPLRSLDKALLPPSESSVPGRYGRLLRP